MGIVCILGGLLLLTAALCLAFYNIREEAQAVEAASSALQQMEARKESPETTEAVSEEASTSESGSDEGETEIRIPDYLRDPQMAMPEVEIDGQNYIGVVDVPSLGLRLPVISEWTKERLKIAPCRFEGSLYLDDLIVMAHNYKRFFGPLLKINMGDLVYFEDMSGNVFSYEVVEIEVMGRDDVQRMLGGEWDLTLFTCTADRQRRVAIRCQRTTV